MHIGGIGVDEDSDFMGERAQAMARLATLQRLREEMARNNRQAMVRTIEQMIEAGRIVALATTGLTRPANLPNIPTVAELGFPGFEALNWYAFVAPGKTPAVILDRWNAEIVKVLRDPSVQADLVKHGVTPHPTSRAELAEFMRKESAQWGAIVRERKIGE